jgi:hypothetical protein
MVAQSICQTEPFKERIASSFKPLAITARAMTHAFEPPAVLQLEIPVAPQESNSIQDSSQLYSESQDFLGTAISAQDANKERNK